MTADFAVCNLGTIHLLTPLTAAAWEWTDANIPADAQRSDASVMVEHRYIGDIVAGAVDDGLTVERV